MPQLAPISWLFLSIFFWFFLLVVCVCFWWFSFFPVSLKSNSLGVVSVNSWSW